MACSTATHQWIEVSVMANSEAADAVAEVLSPYADGGLVMEAGPEGWNAGSVAVRAYLPASDQLEASRCRVEQALWHLGQIRPISAPIFRPVAEADWAEAWKKRLKILRVGQRIVIRPSWLDYSASAGDVVIELDPGMAFGTGLHPTTQMCLAALEELVWQGAEVLDLGTGSGILAIAAAKLGARRVLAVDNDPQAVGVAQRNVIANRVKSIVSVKLGSLPEVSGSYDLVAINILARVIADMVREGLGAKVSSGGVLLAAGIMADQEPEVAAALREEGLAHVRRRQRGDWVNLVARRD